jgi:5-methylcytosine-specific restriction endonuclease McrA
MRFEVNHLESYDDESLLDELRRVAALLDKPKLTLQEFSANANVHGSTLQKRFGGWRGALRAAGLSDRADQSNLRKSRDEILEVMKLIAEKLGNESITLRKFEAHSGMTGGPVRRIFGSWGAALNAAGLQQSALGKRYTDDECFENMLSVWTHYGRPPQHDEMNEPPSLVGSKAYVRRWGTWRKALQAFVERVNSGVKESSSDSCPQGAGKQQLTEQSEEKRGPRDIPLALRYFVLKRDDFRCVVCGESPAITRGVVLHVDHIQPWSKGGATVADNLRTTCQACNLGKGASPA